ncbi:SRPBCC domain-containing protein [Lentzea sp. NPDC060358]|uniref:SRPBCC domain-containing protein n=1 Tax=Lentzea sp. NPDC060358 TaxID=3347103 RepID=UPI003653CEA7
MLVAGLVLAMVATGAPLDPREAGPRSVVHRVDTAVTAPVERIYGLITDFSGYARWNPWVVKAAGGTSPGDEVKVDVVLGPVRMAAAHTVLNGVPGRRFCWRDAGWNAWFVYAQRCRTLTPRPDGTVLVSNEILVDGVLSGGADLVIGKALRDGMRAENAALKREAESAWFRE